jgi:hypothetical protein
LSQIFFTDARTFIKLLKTAAGYSLLLSPEYANVVLNCIDFQPGAKCYEPGGLLRTVYL